MKRISYYITALVVLGGVIVGGWAWQKYFRATPPRLLEFSVERGDLRDLVKARGDVRPAKELDLEFPFSGIVRRIYVVEGQNVLAGEALAALDMNELAIDLRRFQAVLAQQRANLQKLVAGPTAEDIVVLETKLQNAATALADARRNLLDKIRDAYTRTDDAIRNYIDQFFDNPRSSDPQLNIVVSEFALETRIETSRRRVEEMLAAWAGALVPLTADGDLDTGAATAEKNLGQTAAFLDDMALAVNTMTPTATLSRTTIEGYRAAVGTARTNVNTGIINLTAAREKLRNAESSRTLAADELAVKKAGTRPEDIAIAKGQVAEADERVAATGESMRKATLRAPADAKVLDIAVESGEFIAPGKVAVALASSAYEIQTDISELDIGHVRPGSGVEFTLDAFPGRVFSGSVASIDEQPVVKDGDTYYRAHIAIKDGTDEARIGMKADVAIVVSEKADVLRIPKFAVTEKDEEATVLVAEGDEWQEVVVITGISDGENVEIVSGLTEGQTVIVEGK